MHHSPKVTLYFDVNVEDCTYAREFCYEIHWDLITNHIYSLALFLYLHKIFQNYVEYFSSSEAHLLLEPSPFLIKYIIWQDYTFVPITLICFGPAGTITHAMRLTLLPNHLEARDGYKFMYNFCTDNLDIQSRSLKQSCFVF